MMMGQAADFDVAEEELISNYRRAAQRLNMPRREDKIFSVIISRLAMVTFHYDWDGADIMPIWKMTHAYGA